MNNQKLAPILLFASLTILAPGLASAAAINIDFTGMGKAEIVTVAGARNVSAWAGELTWTWFDGKPAGAADSFYSYCVDLLNNEQNRQAVDISSTEAMTTPNFGAQKAAWLFNTYAATVHATGTTAMAAGLQLAIWEVLYDDGVSLTAGTNFRAVTTGTYATSSAAIARGTEFLQGLAAAGECVPALERNGP